MSHVSVFSAFAHCFRTLSLIVVDLVRLAFSRGAFPTVRWRPRISFFVTVLFDNRLGGELIKILAQQDFLPRWNEPTLS
jgi:hypothetical protein